ncbi:permease [Metabacillus sp. RGM 3146]|uniref:permease n=1 Tax=Metabacillus sp. RGM 3146 TaxID=3401092 RepID=UPI003B9BB87E
MSIFLPFLRGLAGFFFLILVLYLFLFGQTFNKIQIPEIYLNQLTILLSIVMEAIPFILLGVFVSAVLQNFVSEEAVQRFFSKKGFLLLLPAALLGIIFPICECGIIPVVRRLIKKGMPAYLGITVLAAVPIINPVVFFSTIYAFQTKPEFAFYRTGLALAASLILGLISYLLFSNQNVLRTHTGDLEKGGQHGANKWKNVFYHAVDEFFDTGKYLIIGALLASFFQTFMNREWLASLGTNDHISPLLMMGLSFLLSVCSESDAFIGRTFLQTFSDGSILAFLVFGPMLDFKNTIMLFKYFKTRYVLFLMILMVIVVYSIIIIFQKFYL